MSVSMVYNNGLMIGNVYAHLQERHWHHLVVVTNEPSSSDSGRIYKDGVYVSGFGGNGGTYEGGEGNMRINGSLAYFDELYFWNRKLSAQEVQTLFKRILIIFLMYFRHAHTHVLFLGHCSL